MVRRRDREHFDQLLEAILDSLPAHLLERLEEVPVIVDDEPTLEQLEDLHLDPNATELCGLHWGVPLTNRSVEDPSRLPDTIHIFRGPIMRLCADEESDLQQQIRITLLHELGHHFGLDEDDLEALGYG